MAPYNIFRITVREKRAMKTQLLAALLLLFCCAHNLGAQNVTWTPVAIPGMENRTTVRVLAGADDQLWALIYHSSAGTTHKQYVARYKQNEWTLYSAGNGLQLRTDSTRLYDLIRDRQGNIWVSADRALNRFDGTEWKAFALNDSLAPFRTFTKLACDSAGNIWVASTSFRPIQNQGPFTHGEGFVAIHRFDGEVWSTYFNSNSAGSDYVKGFTSIGVSSSGTVWATCYQHEFKLKAGLYRFDGNGWDTLDLHSPDTITFPFAKEPNVVTAGRNDDIWIGYDKGRTRIDGQSYGVFSGGITNYNGATWQDYPKYILPADSTDRRSLEIVRALHFDRENNLWAATEYGITKYDGNRWQEFRPGDVLPGNSINSTRDIATGPGGIVWVATDNGLLRMTPPPASIAQQTIGRGGATIYPFPAKQGTALTLELPYHDAEADITITNALGEIFGTTILSRNQHQNGVRIQLSTSDLVAGTYYIRSNGREGITAIPMIIIN